MGQIETDFDKPIEEDVVLEEVENELEIKETLQGSENIYKGFLYLKKLMNAASPFVNAIVKVDTIDTEGNKQAYTLDEKTGLLVVKNIHTIDNVELYFNGGKFILFPYETIEVPVDATTTIELLGEVSLIESEYKL